MGKDKKKEAERQRCLRLKRKSELNKFKAFYAYAQRKSTGLIEEFEAEQATLKLVDPQQSTSTEQATPTNFEAPVHEPTYFRIKTTEATTATNPNHAQWSSILRASTDSSPNFPISTFKIQRLKQKFY